MADRNIFDRFGSQQLHPIMALLVLLITFFIYDSTKAPTLSFWDCGEFIACSYTLGIPHPPGTPLYILIGRVFTLIPFHDEISARVNMLSAMSGALAAMFAFLITFRLIRFWYRNETFSGWKKAIAYVGSLVGTAMFAFGNTHWNNTTEAEVYTPAMLVLVICIWLFLRWLDRRQDRRADRYLILIAYLAFLSIGIHMTTFLFMPALFLMVIIFSKRHRTDYRFYITGALLFLISLSLDAFFENSYLYLNGIWFLILLGGSILDKNYMWRFSLLLFLAAAIGLSCQLFTPIRSAQNPSINQNNPAESFSTFKRFLERKQYGDQSMFTRALTRRGQWHNQLGTFERIGFWGFFSHQYGFNGRYFGFLFVLGLLGMFEMARRKPSVGWPYILMVILGTLFLVWYMNFADGTRQDPIMGDGHIEVRDRDYFFTPGFILFGIAIGLGVAGLMQMVYELTLGKLKSMRTPIMTAISLLLLLIAVPVRANYSTCDRSRNYTPYDFANNLLESCDPDAILFVAGDNDTFPVWCLQEVYGVRPDITTVNLALSNTSWYVKQIRDYMKIPIRWNDAQISALRHRISGDGRMYRVQDQVLDEILTVNQWLRPIHFALTVGSEARQYRGRDLGNYLTMQGMAYRLIPEDRPGSIDMEKSRRLFYEVFNFRSLADSTIYLDERTRALTGNYTTALVLMADSLRKTGNYDGAIELTRKAIEIVPFEPQTYRYLAQIFGEAGYDDSIRVLMNTVSPDQTEEIYLIWGLANRLEGRRDKAKSILRAALDLYPDSREAFQEYSLMLYEDGQMVALQKLIEAWLAVNPTDEEVRRTLQELFVTPRMPASPTRP